MMMALLMCSTLVSFGQKIVVTPNGLRDSENSDKTFVVIDAEGKTSKQLYDNSIKYVNKNYKNPDHVIKSKIEGEYLRFITHVDNFLIIYNGGVKVSVDVDYTIDLSFKDSKVKFEISEINMYGGDFPVLFTGGAFDGYPIYNKKLDLKRPETKTDIENYFNLKIKSLSNFLLEVNTEEKW
jgi:hypothetical protein